MTDSTKPPITQFIYYPRQRGQFFPIIVTDDVTNETFKKATKGIDYEDVERRPIFIRDFEKRFHEIVKDKSGNHNHEYTIHNSITEDELQYLIREN